jgi:hypothetical protein
VKQLKLFQQLLDKIIFQMDTSGMVDRTSNAFEEASTLAALATATQESTQMSTAPTVSTPSTTRAQTTTVPASAIQVGPGNCGSNLKINNYSLKENFVH